MCLAYLPSTARAQLYPNIETLTPVAPLYLVTGLLEKTPASPPARFAGGAAAAGEFASCFLVWLQRGGGNLESRSQENSSKWHGTQSDTSPSSQERDLQELV